ncbi:hypothetical protein B0J11DRAFT_76877 [Dendryphion nanum]|uniref:Rhodopsin domain-containing protein n=1 Tax=Dendryphion nanum TaxID=256645 RepID=A0A9P9DGF1_9PLEO|nr:hypothetical protein B0J11DRAFT_76877 [Dendryphion nanum]
MAGDFPNLSSDTMANWPELDLDPTTRGWYPPYAITLAALSTAFLVARIDSQVRKSYHGLGIDDALLISAWLFAILFTASSASGTLNSGFNRHMWDVPAPLYSRAALVRNLSNTIEHFLILLKIEWLSEGAFTFSTCLTKICVLLFYRRLDPPCPKNLRRIISCFIAFAVAYSMACILTQVLLCRPTSSYWHMPRPKRPVQRSCSSEHLFYPIQGTFDALSIFYSILIPVLVLRNLPMSKFQRIGLRIVALLGLVVFGASITRTTLLYQLETSTNGDATWNGFNVFVWAQLECQLAIICASLPFLQRYFAQYRGTPIVFVNRDPNSRNDSVMSRVGSSLSGQIKRLPFGRSSSPRQLEISKPRPHPPAVEIPEWEFETLAASPKSPEDEQNYDRYLAGRYGPPVPPKDSRELFDQYRREHGEIV